MWITVKFFISFLFAPNALFGYLLFFLSTSNVMGGIGRSYREASGRFPDSPQLWSKSDRRMRKHVKEHMLNTCKFNDYQDHDNINVSVGRSSNADRDVVRVLDLFRRCAQISSQMSIRLLWWLRTNISSKILATNPASSGGQIHTPLQPRRRKIDKSRPVCPGGG